MRIPKEALWEFTLTAVSISAESILAAAILLFCHLTTVAAFIVWGCPICTN